MKKLLTITILLIIHSVQASVSSNLFTYATGAEMEAYYITLDVTNQTPENADIVVWRYVGYDLDIVAAETFVEGIGSNANVHSIGEVYFKMDREEDALLIVTNLLASVPDIRDIHAVEIYKHTAAIYIYSKTAPVSDIVDKIIISLEYPILTLDPISKHLLGLYGQYGVYGSTRSKQSMLKFLDTENRPIFTSIQDAVWWSDNITGRVAR